MEKYGSHHAFIFSGSLIWNLNPSNFGVAEVFGLNVIYYLSSVRKLVLFTEDGISGGEFMTCIWGISFKKPFYHLMTFCCWSSEKIMFRWK